VVPENIHIPNTEGTGNSEGVGGGQRPRKFWRDGGLFLSLENGNSKEVRGLT